MKNNVHGKIGFCFVILAALCLIVGIVLIIVNQKPISNNSKKESSSNESVIEDYNLNMSNNSDFLVDKYINFLKYFIICFLIIFILFNKLIFFLILLI